MCIFSSMPLYFQRTLKNLLTYLLTYLLNYLLTYSMEQSSSWEGKWFLDSQEIPLILCNPKVHYRIHKCAATVPILSQIDPVHPPTSLFLKIHFNIILPPTPGSTKYTLKNTTINLYRAIKSKFIHWIWNSILF